MADNSGNTFLGFVLGGVVVALAVIGILVYNGGNFPGGDTSIVKIEVPKVIK